MNTTVRNRMIRAETGRAAIEEWAEREGVIITEQPDSSNIIYFRKGDVDGIARLTCSKDERDNLWVILVMGQRPRSEVENTTFPQYDDAFPVVTTHEPYGETVSVIEPTQAEWAKDHEYRLWVYDDGCAALDRPGGRVYLDKQQSAYAIAALRFAPCIGNKAQETTAKP